MSRPGTRPDSLIRLFAEIEDVHRFAHLEGEDLAAVREGAGLQHQLDRLLDAHEVARHGGIGHRHRSPGGDLAEEGGHHGAATPQHVPEADDAEDRPLPREGADDVLGHPLRPAHHARRTNGFVGRDEDEPLGVHAGGGLHHVRGAEDVGVERFLRMVLEDRDVLVGGGVEDHLRPVLAEHLEHPLAIADVGQDR